MLIPYPNLRSELLQHTVGVILDAYVDLNHSVSESKDDDTSTNNEEDANMKMLTTEMIMFRCMLKKCLLQI